MGSGKTSFRLPDISHSGRYCRYDVEANEIPSQERFFMQEIVLEEKRQLDHFEVIVMGGGPAGLAAGTYTTLNGAKTLILEANKLGGPVPSTPWVERCRHVQEMIEQAKTSGVPFHEGEPAIELEITGKEKSVKTTKAQYSSDALVIATGLRSKTLGIPGEQWLKRGVSYCAQCDAAIFEGREVAVIGLGASGVDQAVRLADAAEKVVLILLPQQREPEIRKELLESTNIELLKGYKVLGIEGDFPRKKVMVQESAESKPRRIEVNGVFIAAGIQPSTRIVQSAGIRTHLQGCITVDRQQRTNVSGVLAAGNCTNHGGLELETCKGEGLVAGLAATLFIELRRLKSDSS